MAPRAAGRVARSPGTRAGEATFRPLPHAFLVWMTRAILVLVALGVVSAFVYHGTDRPALRGLAQIFLFDRERNLPTLFNFSILLCDALLLGIVAWLAFQAHSRWRWHWLALGGLLFLLAFDEAAQLHERLGFIGRQVVEPTGMFRLPWVVAGIGFAALVGLAYLRFLLALPWPIQRLILLAGTLYVGGAIGIEMLGAAYASEYGLQTTTIYELIATCEETAEMFGLAIFGYGLLRLLQDCGGQVAVKADPGGLERAHGGA